LKLSSAQTQIPDPQVIAEFQPGKKWHSTVMEKPTLLSMKMFYYNFNWVQGNWTLGHVLPGKAVLKGKFNLHQHRVRRNMRMAANVIWDAGWHGSYFLSVENIIHKIESFIHQEYNKAEIKSEDHIMECIMNGKNLYGRRGSEFDYEHYDYKQLPLPLIKLHEQVCKSQNVTLSGGGKV
jgi:beta-1,4-mannosyl-glycoprotein beta-1,4-N-acetylglucosaminyltransferase